MVSFRHNPYSSESYVSQWRKYLESFGKDIKKDIRKSIKEASQQQSDAIHKTAKAVSGTFEKGFEQLSSEMNLIGDKIAGTVKEIGNLLDWRMTMMIEAQRITNILAQDIALLLRIPDVQKERQYYIEQGLNFLKNATIDPDLYQDALEKLLEAEKREKTDYFVLHRIGLIYLYSAKHLDIRKAEEYFLKAAKYAQVESDPNAVRIANILAGDVRSILSEQETPLAASKWMAADSCLQAAIAFYIQGKFSEAVEFAGKAFSLAPQMVEAGFTQAKALAASNNDEDAAQILEKVIETDRNYSIKTLDDLDLAPKSAVQQLLIKLRDNAVRQASQRLAKCKNEMIQNSSATELIHMIEKYVPKNTYLDALHALDELTKEREWTIKKLLPSSCQQILSGNTHLLKSVSFSPNGNLLACSDGSSIKIWEVQTGKELLTLLGHSHDVSSICFSPDGKLLASGSWDGTKIWEVQSGKELLTLSEHSKNVETAVSFSPDGSLVACGIGKDKNSEIWDIKSGRQLMILTAELPRNCWSVSFSPDGKLLASGYGDEIKIWEVQSGRDLITLSKHSDAITSICFSPNGKLLASGSWDQTIKIWEVQTGKELLALSGHWREVCSISFSPDGTLLASGSFDRIIKIWEVQSGKELLALSGHSDYIWSVSFSSDGKLLASSSKDCTIKLWKQNELKTITVNYPLESFIQFEKENNEKINLFNREKEEEKEEAKQLFKEAEHEKEKQNKKWFGNDYTKALQLYQKAAYLGFKKAEEKIELLKQKMEKR